METYLENYKHWYESVTAEERAELDAIAADDKELRERFSLPLAFGTAGMRGTIGLGTFKMNLYTVARATAGLADYIASEGAEARKRGVVISYDTRRMSFEFAMEAARVLAYNKIKVYLFENVRPVPICSFTVGHLKTFSGIMITASHNPKEYNGYKVYGEDGAQLSPEATARVVSYIEKRDYFGVRKADVDPSRENVMGKDGYALNDYITVIGKSVDEAYFEVIEKLSLSPEAVAKEGGNLKIVYTPLHGSGYKPVTTILSRMHIPYNVVPEQALPDSEFPTVKMPNPEMPDALTLGIKLAEELGSDVVIGTDPDADRMGVAVRSDKGDFVLLTGNQTGVLLMDYILRRHTEKGTLPKNAAVVKTIVTTSLARKVAEHYGATSFDVLTGFKFIGEKIDLFHKTGAHTFLFGYEESYGYLAGTHAKDKDAVVSTMLFAEMVCYYKSIGIGLYERLQQIFRELGFYAEKTISVYFKGLQGMAIMSEKTRALRDVDITEIAGYKVESVTDFLAGEKTYSSGKKENIDFPKSDVMYYFLEGGDWVVIRPSGTEPKLKLYVSCAAANAEEAMKKAETLLNDMKGYVEP
ncbi:MAG: phospho-sugar mutase [Clostridia bacterium]|nr:phospho-sugar mutase [Clostridia bacterium]